VGSRFRAHGLQNDTKKNGMLGTIQRWIKEKGRWSVKYDNGRQCNLRPVNLEIYRPSPHGKPDHEPPCNTQQTVGGGLYARPIGDDKMQQLAPSETPQGSTVPRAETIPPPPKKAKTDQQGTHGASSSNVPAAVKGHPLAKKDDCEEPESHRDDKTGKSVAVLALHVPTLVSTYGGRTTAIFIKTLLTVFAPTIADDLTTMRTEDVDTTLLHITRGDVFPMTTFWVIAGSRMM
jgi:hypothetical protein